MLYFRSILLLLSLTLITGCNSEKKKLFMPDSTRWTDQDVPLSEISTGSVNTDSVVMAENMKVAFSPADSMVSGRPASFYLNRSDVSQLAKDFYQMKFIPGDNDATYPLCDSILSKNDTTRPFYYLLFIRLMRISDGGLAEGMSDKALKYFFQFPKEFYSHLKEPLYREFYNSWVEFIASSLMLPGIENPSRDELKSYIVKEQTKKIKSVTTDLFSQITSFADSVANMQVKVANSQH